MYIYISFYGLYLIYRYTLGKFHHDLTVLPSPGMMVGKGNSPNIAQYNLTSD